MTVWRVPADAERAARRLLELGARGVGGFVEDGRDDDGAFLVRRAATPTLTEWLREHDGPIAWPTALALVTALADAAAACEEASLFPGALEPGGLVVRGDALEIRADALVGALLGASTGASTGRSGGSARWLAPEQAAGRPADNASNRYLIGLVLYRLLGGEHPFASRGLRLGLDDQAQRGAPPLAPEVAATLPPGLQSLCLRLLDPDPARRPPTAAAIARDLRRISAPPAPARDPDPERDRDRDRLTSTPSAAPSAPSAAPPPRRPRQYLALLPVLLAIPLAVTAVAAITPAPPRAIPASPAAPLAHADQVADCASCHPRQTAEWSRSVMAHAVDSPLFQSLEMLIEEQVGRDRTCPDGAGVLRPAGAGACTDRRTGLPVTGSGGELWCVNCHAPSQNLGASSVPAWDRDDPASRRPLRDLLPAASQEGIGCVACHQVTGPVQPGDRYQGNPTWRSAATGQTFTQRPEDRAGRFGIANSGYAIDLRALLASPGDTDLVPGGAHRRASDAARGYLRSSEFCGSCHDVRLFGTNAIGADLGEHFKRLRNAYTEWARWSEDEVRAGREPASCQDCHMSLYPGVCVAAPADAAPDRRCPPGTVFEARAPGSQPLARSAAGSPLAPGSVHYFTGVDVPLATSFDPAAIDDATLDVAGLPLGARQRRDLLLAAALRMTLDAPRAVGGRLEIPVVIENVGAGHRVPAGFSQERELWIELTVTDARGRVVYQVGQVRGGDDDLRDKLFLRVNTDDTITDREGRPLGLFGADLADGPDVPQWSPPPAEGGTSFRGRGLINFQNGFLRCVTCIGEIDARGACQPGPGQQRRRADRYADGDYDADTGECRSNLRGAHRFLETYFPIGALDASRGVTRGPDAIIDTRSLPPSVPVRYVYDLDAVGAVGPFTVEARLLFRAFPPFLVRAFIAYEQAQARRGTRPGGPLVEASALQRLEVVELATVRVELR